KRATIMVEPFDVRVKPPLLEANFSVALRSAKKNMDSTLPSEVLVRMEDETMRWWGLHQLGGNSPLRFGHSFMHWWENYHAVHPDYFATPPDGVKQMPPDRVKLCTSNPAVVAQVIAEWKAAGAPDSWNIGPNDGRGFCACDRCRALDEGGPHDTEAVWGGDVDLSRRHVLFANEVLRRMKALNPRATLCTYAYSTYRNVPRDVPLEPGMAIEFVGSYTARDMWTEWTGAGAKVGLRPNWLHSGAVAPFLPLHTMGGFLEFARNNGMIQFHFDSLMGYWATQGPNYYLIARSVARPELGVDDIIDEWCSAFGSAAPAVKDYIAYWETFTEETGYMLACGGSVSTKPDSRYERLCSENGIPSHPLVGSWRTLPLLYTDDVLAKAETILADADRLASDVDRPVAARIRFLRDGLNHLRLTRDLIALVYSQKPDKKELARQTEAVLALRNELSPRHVVWGDVATGAMVQRGIKPFAAKKVTKQDLKGL
ncbi:MAG: DUF4838 domain-containing protein, partial [Kiritimatiellales bacterium]|nr:DUF4838 domain-containing protein [Kiritimatiellales bacterium]